MCNLFDSIWIMNQVLPFPFFCFQYIQAFMDWNCMNADMVNCNGIHIRDGEV
jgi:hypothetical protein